MKRIVFIMCLFAMMAAGLSAKAQGITITLHPGCTWISYPNTEVMDIPTALGDFVPMEGDIIKSQNASAVYHNGIWIGLENFTPGRGYKYYSNRSEIVEFVFSRGFSSVTTAEPIDITATSALVGGTVNMTEGGHVFLRGVCWGTEPGPNIDGNHTTNGTSIGDFSETLVGLTTGTVYYVRAYAVTDYGLKYGEEKWFIPIDNSNVPEGAINGKFTINSNGNQVYFSQGNLQYIGSASTPYWKFADNQWDCLGTTTDQNSNSQTVDRDLFGWGTSGWNCGNTCYHPWDTYNSSGSYYGPAGVYNLIGTYANSDWGVYNSISNGGNQSNQWRTLSKAEWKYVFDDRTTDSGIRFAKANVNDVNGVILLPDNWNSNYYGLSDTNTKDASYTSNTVSASEWSFLEQLGAVFMPANGYRFGASVRDVGSRGYYWSCSFVNNNYAYGVYFYASDNASDMNPQDCCNRAYGRGVRLVCVAE
ncbi:MAG: hypothetical protein IJK78_07645 [Bacteroidales bacterium]|nr:hypothetical protein [Bacteroidales bacterium]